MRYGDYCHSYQLDDLPGCSQVVVSHSMFIIPAYRNQGYSYKCGFDRLRMMRDLHYDYAICTVDSSNEAEIKALNVMQFSPIGMFDSRKTGHLVRIYGKSLNNE